MVHKIFGYIEPFMYASPVWQTDRRTDGEMDRITIAIACVYGRDHIAFTRLNTTQLNTTGQFCDHSDSGTVVTELANELSWVVLSRVGRRDHGLTTCAKNAKSHTAN